MFFSLKKDNKIITRGHEVILVKGQCRLDIRKYSFSQRTIKEWNKSSAVCVTASSVNMLNNKADTYPRRAVYTYIKNVVLLINQWLPCPLALDDNLVKSTRAVKKNKLLTFIRLITGFDGGGGTPTRGRHWCLCCSGGGWCGSCCGCGSRFGYKEGNHCDTVRI